MLYTAETIDDVQCVLENIMCTCGVRAEYTDGGRRYKYIIHIVHDQKLYVCGESVFLTTLTMGELMVKCSLHAMMMNGRRAGACTSRL